MKGKIVKLKMKGAEKGRDVIRTFGATGRGTGKRNRKSGDVMEEKKSKFNNQILQKKK